MVAFVKELFVFDQVICVLQEKLITTANLSELAERLFPIARSITGPAISQSANILSAHVPWQMNEIESGSKIFDWEAPMEWELLRARLWGPNGDLILDSNQSCLCVVNFSVPFSGIVSRSDLESHLYSRPDLPDATPYVTSYYANRWGFCLPENLRQTLGPGDYRVEIETRIFPGSLRYWTARLDADVETDETILVSTYLCHPSLGNNELSGPLAMVRVFEALSRRRRLVNYVFLLAPETIGSLAFLASSDGADLENIIGGIVMTCLGGPWPTTSIKLSRSDWLNRPSIMDNVCRDLALLDSENFSSREFDPSEGSDERQFCSPGFNLPMVQAARTVYGQYEQYHTSLDDLEYMDISSVEESAKRICVILEVFERSEDFPISTNQKGEPFLSKKNLYEDINFVGGSGGMGNKALRMKLLSLSDGTITTRELWAKLVAPPGLVVQQLGILEKAGLIFFQSKSKGVR